MSQSDKTVSLLDCFMVSSGVASVTVHDKSDVFGDGSINQDFNDKVLTYGSELDL